MHAGIFDVLNSAREARFAGLSGSHTRYASYLTFANTSAAVDDDLAAGVAARDLLVFALPKEQAYFQAQFASRYGATTQAEATALAGAVVGPLKQARTGDGSASTTPYNLDGVAGSWRPTGGTLCPDVSKAATPQFGRVKPFVLTSTTQFRQPLPGGYTTYASLLSSQYYANNVKDVQSVGDRNAPTTARSVADTETAFFWANDLDGTYKPPGQLLETTAAVVAKSVSSSDPVASSKVFTQASLALADAAIAAWDQKYLLPLTCGAQKVP